ncbi:MAG: alpha/beta fold hydrolase [Micropepsaceae bacterium]
MTNQTNVWLGTLVLVLTLLVSVPVAQASGLAPMRFTVTVEGQGPDVIMIPGLASSADVWRPAAEKLKARYRVHLIQVSGFAGTPARANASGPMLVPLRDEIIAYIRANKLDRPTIVGHSLGGLMALMIADAANDAAGRLVIVDALPFYGMLMGPTATVESVTPAAAQMRDKVKAQSPADYAAGQTKTMAILVKSKGPTSDAATKASQTSDPAVVAQAMYEDFITDMRPRLGSIKAPTLVLYAYDPSMGIPQPAMDGLYQSAYAAMPSKKLVRIDGSYHFIQIDQPEAFERELAAFLTAR